MTYDIIAWLNKQSPWLQEAAIRLEANGKLNDDDIAELARILKGEITITPNLSRFRLRKQIIKSLKLKSLGSIRGIEKLNPQKPLCFGESNLSVIYGRNGSGKSGYTRILKKLSGKSNEQLLPNVYSPTQEAQICEINFLLEDIPLKRTWNGNDEIIEPLTQIDFFDGAESKCYIEQEKEASYITREMIIFEELSCTCEKVMNVLSSESDKLLSKLPRLPIEFNDTNIGKKYLELSYKTFDKEIEKWTLFADDDIKKIESLQERLKTENPVAKAANQRKVQAQVESIKKSIENRLRVIDKTFIEQLAALCSKATSARKIAQEGTNVLRDIAKLDGVGEDTWRSLWEAAKAYSTTAYPKNEFPYIGEMSRCLLCHQELDDEAKNRLQRFDGFIQGSLETAAKKAEQDFIKTINELPAVVQENDVKTRFQAANLDDDLCTKIWQFIKKINSVIENYRASNIVEYNDKDVSEAKDIILQLSVISNSINDKAIQFEEDAKSFDKIKVEGELLELRAMQWVSQQKDAIIAEVELKKRIRQYDIWKKQTNTRMITTEAGNVSEVLLTNAYIARFNTELQKLGAHRIAVELIQSKNIKGSGKYKIRLRNAHNNAKVMNILSDGEKRIIALAAFLADVTGREANVPFIFDDPISSLDQDFEEKTICRLAELSKNRQVIIFTHRLSFLSIITDKVDDDCLDTICINSEPWGTGEPSDIPINSKNPKKALNKLHNERVLKAKKTLETEGLDTYNIHAQSICSDFRKLIERIVEIHLLADVVQRHRRAINTMNKIQNLAKIEKKDCDLIDKMMTKYSCYEHSQSVEAPVELPSPDELAKDTKEVIDWLEEFSKR